MNAAHLARLQQQLAQFGRNPGQQQQMMNPNAMGGMGNPQQQQLQQAYMQQQQLQQNQNQQGGMQQVRRNSQMGMGNNSAAALAMMQQQQQQQAAAGNSQMANANMSSYWNALQSQNSGGAIDASNASGAQLAALAGMNMGGNSTQMGPNSANMLLGNRSNQGQNHQAQGIGGNQQMQAMGGQTTDATQLQQQIAQLQRQLQQQQQNQQPQQQMSMQGQMGRRDSVGSGGSFQQMQQQQLFQQMQQQMTNGMMGHDAQQSMGMTGGQQQNNMGNDQFSSMAAMMQGQQMQNMHQGVMSQGVARGSLNEQDLLLQQNQLLRSGGMSQGGDPSFMMNQQSNNNNQADLMGRRTSMMQQMDNMGQSVNSQSQNNLNFNNASPFDMDSSNRPIGNLSLDLGEKTGDQGANQKSFLDGSFAGGWQSNADLPDRRRIIFSILEVIRQMRPDTNKISQKLPHMAKSLEEHLYRSAQTKEEYLDPSTLKKRLQLIAHGLELHRSTSSGSSHSTASQEKIMGGSDNVPSEAQQFQQFLQGNGSMNQGQGGIASHGMPGMSGQNFISSNQNNMQMDLLKGFGGMSDQLGGSMDSVSNQSGILKSDGVGGSYQDRNSAQKKKVIRQQQQRLLLLRHASKCKDGPACKTKFCGQMMTLWKHMKKCRDKNCKTSHCLSSRCVLNHYRICKSQGRTSTCEVCGPVMEQIKRQDQSEELDSNDPLAAKPDPDLPNQALPQLQQQMSSFSEGQQQQQTKNVQAMQQLYQQQGIQNPNQQVNVQALGGGLNSQANDSQDPKQLQQLQSAQQKVYQQQQVLKHLQKQQAQLLEQQKLVQDQLQHMDPTSQQGQQLQQQSMLLQQLQRRCQQQQVLIQQELVLQMKALQGQMGQGQMGQGQMGQGGGQAMQVLGNNSQSSQHSQHSQHGQMSRQNSISSQNLNQVQNMQSNQLHAQMQALSKNHMQALNDNNGNNVMHQMQNQMQQQIQGQEQMQNQMPNQLQQTQSQSVNEQSELEQALSIEQALSEQGANDLQDDSQPQQSQEEDPQLSKQPEENSEQQIPNETILDDVSQSLSKPSSDNGEKDSDATRQSLAKARMRGRGGKGKRLREMAGDLNALGSSPAEANIMSALTKKRTASDMDDEEKSEPASKSQKTDDNDGDVPVPDTEKSGLTSKEGESDESKESDKKDGEGDQNPSLASSMPKGDVEQHLLLLHKGLHLTSRTITHKCLPLVQQLIDDPFGWVFRDAVDPVVFGLPDYFEVVKNPMHLLLVKKKLENAVYTDMASFERDVKLVFENAILYNGEESEVGQLANTMMGVFEREYKKVCECM